MYICKICGYDKLEYPQYLETGEPNFVICECCGFQSGYDDLDQGISVKEYRCNWLKNGAKWFNEKKKPENWDISRQMQQIGVKI